MHDISNLFVPARLLARNPYFEVYHLAITLSISDSFIFLRRLGIASRDLDFNGQINM